MDHNGENTDRMIDALDRTRPDLSAQAERLQQETERKLRDGLMAARAKLFEQAQVIEEMSGAPTLHATVVAVMKDNVTIYAQDRDERTKLERGMKMRVLASNYIGEIGEVRDWDRTRVVLDFSDDRNHTYRYDTRDQDDRRPCTLRVRGTGSQKLSDFTHGTEVERVEDGKRGTIISDHIDGDGDVRVRWRRGHDEEWAYVGHDFENEVEPAEKLRIVIAVDGKLMEVPSIIGHDLKPGDVVQVSQENLAILGKVEDVVQTGPLASIINIIDEQLCEVSVDDVPKVVFVGSYDNDQLEVGGRVMLDHSGIVVVRLMPQEKSGFAVQSLPQTRWDDIGGLAEAKLALREVIEMPLLHPEIFQHYGTKPAKGALLYGPPGCGKTMLGKATVCSIAELHGADAVESAFIYVKGPEILEHLVGKGEANVRELFARARKHRKTYGYPAVIFIDEADAILRKRGSGISSDIGDTIVPMFLAEMDGLDDVEAFVLLATNRPDTLDPAVVRDGRIDRKIKITRPDVDSAREIFRIHLREVPLSNGYDHSALADFGVQELFSEAHGLYTLKRRDDADDALVTLGHFVNGGMIAGIVERAKMAALHRDLNAGTMTGLAQEDLRVAVCDSVRENRDLDHSDVLEEMVTHHGDVVRVERTPLAA